MTKWIFMGIGVVAGSLATFLFTKNYYKKYYNDICEEEIASVKETYSKRIDSLANKEKIIDEKIKYSDILNSEKYIDQEEIEEKTEEESVHPEEDELEPYSITPNQFVNEKTYYDKITLFYFTEDGQILHEDGGELYDDPAYLVGPDISLKIGEYEDNVAYIRNDKLSIDFEVIAQYNSSDAFLEEELN